MALMAVMVLLVLRVTLEQRGSRVVWEIPGSLECLEMLVLLVMKAVLVSQELQE